MALAIDPLSRMQEISDSPTEGSYVAADEPTGNLESRKGAQVMELLGELHAGGATIVMVTHDSRYLAPVRRTVHLFDGHLVGRGSLNLEVA